ncbi:hypothetical protein B0T20DRAFT_478784 [Sordaria brevicollis]|uniref:Uncharacterized protein n=1 Tax=Sordaria brevicollis TaxID=83679 RepID=A0AAE0PGA2_SORBR|nr:hypothetical protein B0T20DRAFT_478784 [Sordaria brevicollis]
MANNTKKPWPDDYPPKETLDPRLFEPVEVPDPVIIKVTYSHPVGLSFEPEGYGAEPFDPSLAAIDPYVRHDDQEVENFGPALHTDKTNNNVDADPSEFVAVGSPSPLSPDAKDAKPFSAITTPSNLPQKAEKDTKPTADGQPHPKPITPPEGKTCKGPKDKKTKQRIPNKLRRVIESRHAMGILCCSGCLWGIAPSQNVRCSECQDKEKARKDKESGTMPSVVKNAEKSSASGSANGVDKVISGRVDKKTGQPKK